MASRLTPLRQIEAKRLFAARDQFDADHFILLMAKIMLGTPNVVEAAAQQLESWNNDRCAIGDQSPPYAEIAEIVLDAAAIYHGETSEEPRAATQADFDVWHRVLATLRGNRDCLERAAAGQVSRGAWEAQAAACGRALGDLEQLLGNVGLVTNDKEV